MSSVLGQTQTANRVLVTSAYTDPEPITSFRRLTTQDRFRVHTLTDDPDEADIILFVENSHYHDDLNYRVLRRHPWVREYREKVFMYNEHDRPWCVLPGLYFSMPRRFLDHRRQRACAYVREMNPLIGFTNPDEAVPDLLFSFTGRRYPNVRTRVLQLEHPRALIRDTSHFSAYNTVGLGGERKNWQVQFAEIMTRSKFVLCPRGVATSSLRPFEAMKAGRVPVIISDQYAFPPGPEWSTFSIVVAENEVEEIPRLLEGRESDAAALGRRARAAWEEWFAPDVLFHRMVEDIGSILEARRWPEWIMQRVPQPLYVEWRARAALRPVKDVVLRRNRA